MPNKKTAIGALTDALYHLKENPLPNRISDPLEGFISSIGPELPFVQKMAFANTWLFKPIIFGVYEEYRPWYKPDYEIQHMLSYCYTCEIEKELDAIKNYYFDAEIINNELHFDYQLKTGVCKNMNASFLLKKMEIV